MKNNGKLATDNLEMATILNEFFSSVFTREDPTNLPQAEKLKFNHPLEDIYFTSLEIERKIEKLKTSSSTGPDGISTAFLKDFKRELSAPLAIIFNKSMTTGEVPEDWRTGNITPIFKKGKKCEAGNYRPISLTSVPCKVMESLIKDKIVDQLTTNCLINSSQHDFTRNKSCTTNLSSLKKLQVKLTTVTR